MASPNGTVIVRPDLRIQDASGNNWYIQQNGQIAITAPDGTTTVDDGTWNVTAIGYLNGQIVQQNNQNLWWTKTGAPGAFDGWSPNGGSHTNPFPQSASGTVIVPNDTAPLVDSNGSLWWIDNGAVVENGTPDAGTARVIEMAYKNGVIWQENADLRWWQKTYTGDDGWGGGAGTLDGPGTLTTAASLTWLGGLRGPALGGIDRANNPAEWSPAVAPKAGDTLHMLSGQMIVTGNSLAGDTVYLGGSGSSNPPACTFTMIGSAAMNLADDGAHPGWPDAVVDLMDSSQWIGGFAAGPYGGGVTVQATGNGTGTFANTNTSVDNAAVIDASVVGTGSFNVYSAHAQARLEFVHAVDSRQIVSVSGYASYGGEFGILQVDDPASYHAATTLGFGEIILKGLQATGYTLNDGLLSLYQGHTVIDTMALTLVEHAQNGGPTAEDFGVSQVGGDVVVHADGTSYHDGGALLPPPNLAVLDTTHDEPRTATGHPYSGPVAGLENEYVNVTADNINIAVSTPNWFIHSGNGDDAIAVNSGTNVLDGGAGSNFLTGGSGTDTFFVDDRGPAADIWSTVVGFHAGDAATIWGVSAQDIGLAWVDGQGATGYTGLTLHATAAGRPTASLTLAGFSQGDLNNGRLSVMFGTDPGSGSAYMYVHGNA